jgi:hypothetical protein
MVKKIARLLILTSFMFLLGQVAFADQPPDPGGGPGGGDLPVGGGSPVGGGLIIMASLGVAYGARKIYSLHQEE